MPRGKCGPSLMCMIQAHLSLTEFGFGGGCSVCLCGVFLLLLWFWFLFVWFSLFVHLFVCFGVGLTREGSSYHSVFLQNLKVQ